MKEHEPEVPAPVGKPTLKQRLAAHINEYGQIAIVTYFTLSILTIIGFSIAIGLGTSPESTTGVLGVIFAGWVAAKATLPIRILITLAVTPVVALVVKRLRRGRGGDDNTVDVTGAGSDAAAAD
ncbi:MAG: hypothetical protein H7138_06155, partial [Myxococcales bacterium]|nr:hypothetical protein [Myxococcales bacterium]